MTAELASSPATPGVAPQAAPSGVPTLPNGHPGHLIPLPKQGRGGDVRHAPFPPLRALDHLTNQHPTFTPEYEAPDGGEAA